MLAIEREGVNERRDRSVPRGTLLHGENQGRVLSSSHRGTRCSSNTTGHQRQGTRCSLSGSWPRIAQRSWAFRRRGPADPAVRPALHLGAHAVSPPISFSWGVSDEVCTVSGLCGEGGDA